MIPYLDLKRINSRFEQDCLNAITEVYKSGWYILGKQVESFETSYAEFNNVSHCIGVANGLDAIILSLRALDIGPGDEVIVPSNTYIATWLAVTYVGAKPIPVEPRLDTYNINPKFIEEKIAPKTKAIIPVNLYGQAAELAEICEIAAKYGLFVVEDNAQAQGAEYLGRKTGSWGHINATSFYPGKNLGALGDAGAITTQSDELASRVKVLRNYGSQVKYYNELQGINSRLDEIQAAILKLKLDKLHADNADRAKLAAEYFSELKGVGDIEMPVIAEGSSSVHHIFSLRSSHRDELQKHLDRKQIGTLIHYPVPPHLQKAYAQLGHKRGDFPIAEAIANTSLSIPLFPGITPSEQQHIISAIKEFY